MVTINTRPWEVPNKTGFSSDITTKSINEIRDTCPGHFIRIVQDEDDTYTGYIGFMRSVMVNKTGMLLRGDGVLMGEKATVNTVIKFMKQQCQTFFGYDHIDDIPQYTAKEWNTICTERWKYLFEK